MFKVVIVLLTLVISGCSGISKSNHTTGKNTSNDYIFDADEQRYMVNHVSVRYFCKKQKSFLKCINPSVLNDFKRCEEYVTRNTGECSEIYLSSNKKRSKNEFVNIGTTQMECGFMEMLDNEGISYTDFVKCFQKTYKPM